MTQDGSTAGYRQGLGRTPRAARRLAGKGERREATCLPLAARVSILNEIGAVLINGVISQVHADIILGEETQVCGVRGRAGLPLPACAQPWPLRLKEMEKKGEVSGLSETGKTEEVRRSTLQYKKCQFLQRLGGALPEGQVRGAELPHWLCSQADLALSPRLISSSAVTLDKSFYSLGCHFLSVKGRDNPHFWGLQGGLKERMYATRHVVSVRQMTAKSTMFANVDLTRIFVSC